MDDLKYARQWIRHAESGEDSFRIDYLYPFVKDSISGFPRDGSRILDVGCGWGMQ